MGADVPAGQTTLGTLTVPSVAIGTISWQKEDAAELREAVRHACREKIAFFDTAERYGSSGLDVALGLGWGTCERELGDYLRTDGSDAAGAGPCADAVVATKFTPSPWRTTAQSVVDACMQSRERLGRDIDLYQIHMPDVVQPLARLGVAARPKEAVFWEGLAECYKRGLVKNVGVSNYGPTLLAAAQDALGKHGVPLASNQINYSLLYRGDEKSSNALGRAGSQATLEAGAALGVRTLAYFPLAMGLLTGKYDTHDGRSPGERGGIDKKRSALEMRDLMRYGDAVAPLLAAMRAVGAKHGGRSCAQVALNWVVCQGAIPVVGCRTAAHVAGAKAGAAGGWRLDADDLALLEAAADGANIPEFQGAGFKRSSEKFVGYGVEKWELD